MRAIVTGGAGFIGSHVVDALLARGDEVCVLDDMSTGRAANLENARAEHGANLTVREVDICSTEAAAAVKEFKPEVIFHLAAQMNVRRSVAEPLFDGEKNVLGTINLLNAAAEVGLKTFILSSTGGAVYGEQDYFPADEEHPVHAECPYGVSKKCAELYIEYFARAHNFCSVALRYANVYGPRQNPKGEAGVVAIFTERALAGESLRVNGDGGQTRDFVYVGDVVDANLRAAAAHTEPGTYCVYNVGTSKETSVVDIVSSIKQALAETKGADIDAIAVEHGPALPGEQRRSVIDCAKIKQALGWQPAVALDEGMKRTVQSYK